MEGVGRHLSGAGDTFGAYLEAFNRGDAAAVAALYAECTHFVNPFSREPMTTRAAVEAFISPMFAAYSDMHAEHDGVVVDGDRVATRLTIHARHTGTVHRASGPVPPTGEVIVSRSAEFMRVDADGLIAEHERIFNAVAVLRQMGSKG